MELIELHETSDRLTRGVPEKFRRYLYGKINWDARLIEISGSRGVGKTTLLLQRTRELNRNSQGHALFMSLDDPWFYIHSLSDTAAEFFRSDGKVLLMDEVHKYPPKYPGIDWSAELKSVYDRFPSLQIVYTGSSVLKLYKSLGDLSRRKAVYNLKGLSLREYLEFYDLAKFSAISLETLVADHAGISNDIISKIRIIPHFRNYIATGYYPFYKEDPGQFISRLKNVINVILESDLPSVTVLPFDTQTKIKQLLAVIASSVPYTPNLSKVREELFITDQRTLTKYLWYLDKAELISLLSRSGKGNQIFRKPDKIYLNNTNLLFCFLKSPETGTLRETFLFNQVNGPHEVSFPEAGDFTVDNSWTFEVGGRNKKRDQQKQKDSDFLVLDDIETGAGKTIPLWLFGFLY